MLQVVKQHVDFLFPKIVPFIVSDRHNIKSLFFPVYKTRDKVFRVVHGMRHGIYVVLANWGGSVLEHDYVTSGLPGPRD